MSPLAVGKRIRKARENTGLSQANLGKRIGKSQVTISHYELGKVEVTLSTINAIAQATNLPLSFFIKEDFDGIIYLQI